MRISHTTRKIVGFTLLALSWSGFVGVPVTAFLPISVGVKASLAVGLLVFGEVAFLLSIAVLGTEYKDQIKGFFRRVWDYVRGHRPSSEERRAE